MSLEKYLRDEDDEEHEQALLDGEWEYDDDDYYDSSYHEQTKQKKPPVLQEYIFLDAEGRYHSLDQWLESEGDTWSDTDPSDTTRNWTQAQLANRGRAPTPQEKEDIYGGEGWELVAIVDDMGTIDLLWEGEK